jgi:hypothetical protein
MLSCQSGLLVQEEETTLCKCVEPILVPTIALIHGLHANEDHATPHTTTKHASSILHMTKLAFGLKV